MTAVMKALCNIYLLAVVCMTYKRHSLTNKLIDHLLHGFCFDNGTQS